MTRMTVEATLAGAMLLLSCGEAKDLSEAGVIAVGMGAQPSTGRTLESLARDGYAPDVGASAIVQETRRAVESCASIRFHCKTEDGKEVLVCDLGKTIEYVFGRSSDAPELTLSVRKEQARTFQWKGFGRWISYTLSIPSNDVIYTVFSGMDRLTEEHALDAGVSVERTGEELARVSCKEPVVMRLEGIDVPEE